jgi:hypothetical protein
MPGVDPASTLAKITNIGLHGLVVAPLLQARAGRGSWGSVPAFAGMTSVRLFLTDTN